jgi:hypothetical protein
VVTVGDSVDDVGKGGTIVEVADGSMVVEGIVGIAPPEPDELMGNVAVGRDKVGGVGGLWVLVRWVI